MKVTFDRKLAQRKLDEARQTKTLWPEIAYLQRPAPDDRVAHRQGAAPLARQQAPVLIADVDEPVFLDPGRLLQRARPAHRRASGWRSPACPTRRAIGRHDRRARARPASARAWSTRCRFGDIDPLQELVPAAVEAARAHLEERRDEYDAAGRRAARRVPGRAWRPGEQVSLLDVLPGRAARQARAGRRRPPASWHDLIDALHTAGEPLLRVLAVLVRVPSGECRMSYDSLTNRGDYLSPHYLAEVLPRDLAKKGGLRAQLGASGTRRASPPRSGGCAACGAATSTPARPRRFRAAAADGDPVAEDERRATTRTSRAERRRAARPRLRRCAAGVVDVERAGETFEVPVAYAGPERGRGRLRLGRRHRRRARRRRRRPAARPGRDSASSETIETGAKLARWLFAADEPAPVRAAAARRRGHPRRPRSPGARAGTWPSAWTPRSTAPTQPSWRRHRRPVQRRRAAAARRGRRRAARRLGRPAPASTPSASPAELREGLRESVQIIANEVLDRIRAARPASPATSMELGDLAKELGRESLRYLYRILFLLYAEARPELGILPVDDEDYVAGLQHGPPRRPGRPPPRRRGGAHGFHLYESLDLLFRMVNDGHRPRGGAELDDRASPRGRGCGSSRCKADLFDAGEDPADRPVIPDPASDDGRPGRAAARHPAARRGPVRGAAPADAHQGQRAKGKTERGGFISYAQLGINQLGAVYEGLMSYTGFIATEELYEVAKNGDPTDGSWMIPASKVRRATPTTCSSWRRTRTASRPASGSGTGPGSFVYRLAGRDRQTSASYYTPQSLT